MEKISLMCFVCYYLMSYSFLTDLLSHDSYLLVLNLLVLIFFIFRETKTSVSSGKADRPAKRKHKCLTENCSDEENINLLPPLPCQPAQQSKTTRFVHKQAAGIIRSYYERIVSRCRVLSDYKEISI